MARANPEHNHEIGASTDIQYGNIDTKKRDGAEIL